MLRPFVWMLPGIRAKMRRRVQAAAGDARRILVVCKGNICRSPFAEAYLKRRGPGLEVESAGHYPAEGRESPPAACEAALRFGVDLSRHRSRVLTRGQVEWADLILIFEPEQGSGGPGVPSGGREKAALSRSAEPNPRPGDPRSLGRQCGRV